MVQTGIPEYFTGKNVLVTGATGFMGKALVEKILRCCPKVATIYVVIRTKKGEPPAKRWSDICQIPLFDKLKSKYPNALDKVVAIPGESTSENFGLSEEHLKLLIEKVNIVYHVAASVRFTEELVSALRLNVKSTHSMLEIAKKMKNLECFVHTSTAYSNIEKVGARIEEKVYDSPLDWRTMLRLADDPKLAEYLPAIQPKLMFGHETTYTLTKRVAETLVEEYSQYFPIVIMRPSLVISSAEDPIPGWLDAHNALSLMADAVRCGVVRVISCDANRSLQFITLDLSIKAFLIATWNVHRKQRKSGVEVYCTSLGDELCMKWSELVQHGMDICLDYPAERQIWHPSCLIIRNPILMTFTFFFLQVIPALLGDLYAYTTRGMTPRFFQMTVKYYKALKGPLSGFVDMDFHFALENYRNLDALILPEDRADFSIDQSKYNALELYKLNALGVVKYVLNEDISPEGLKKRRVRYDRFKLAHRTISAGLLAALCYTLISRLLHFGAIAGFSPL